MAVTLNRITVELYTFTTYFGRATSEWVRLWWGRVAGAMVKL